MSDEHSPDLIAALVNLRTKLEALPEPLRGPFVVKGLKSYLTPTDNLEAGAGDLVATGDWHMEAVYEQIEELQQAAKQTDSEPMEALFSDAADMALWLLRRVEEAQADAYRSSLLAVARLGDLDKANERANKNWRDFLDLRLEIIGHGPMCRDCADENGRCPHSGQPCDPDEAVKEQIATWETAAAQLAALTAERDSWRRVAERCKSEAEGHSMEARTANHTIYEIYQAITGGTGEPGNWHGAEPVREYIDRSEAQLKAAREANQTLHRRAQKAEAVSQSVMASLQNWLDYLTSGRTVDSGPRRERYLFRWAILDAKKRAEKAIAALSQEATK